MVVLTDLRGEPLRGQVPPLAVLLETDGRQALDAANDNMTTRVYRLDGLLPAKKDTGKKNYYQLDELTELIEMVTSIVAPDSWEETGGAGTITSYRDRLVIRNTIQVHRQIPAFCEPFRSEYPV